MPRAPGPTWQAMLKGRAVDVDVVRAEVGAHLVGKRLGVLVAVRMRHVEVHAVHAAEALPHVARERLDHGALRGLERLGNREGIELLALDLEHRLDLEHGPDGRGGRVMRPLLCR